MSKYVRDKSHSKIESYDKKTIDELIKNVINDNLATKLYDFNDKTLKTGIYYAGDATLNAPHVSSWFVLIMKKSDSMITQIAYRYRENEMYIRHYNTVGTEGWKNWVIISNNFSNKEQIIGTWMGKPLYRKIITVTNITSEKSLGISNIDTIFLNEGYSYVTWDNSMSYPASYGQFVIDKPKGTILGRNEELSDWDGVLTVEYTKTTD